MRTSIRSCRGAGLLLAAVACLASGCSQEEPIRTYRIAKTPGAERPPTAPQPPARTGEPTDRMLGAVIPGGDQAWFFKVVGPKALIDALADGLTSYLGAIRLEGGEPVWDTPEGWREEAGGGMRRATLFAPTPEGGEIELSVIGLGLSDDWDALVLDNVNRWRKQLALPPVSPEAIGETTKPLDDVAPGAVLFDAEGWFEAGSMAPFAGGTMAPPPAPAAPAIPQPPRQPVAPVLSYDTPSGWTEDPAPSPIRKASLTTSGGAVVTGFAFPAAGAMGDPLENANRWRREIGLPPATVEQHAEATEEVELLGGEGSYFDFIGEQEATSAAMTERDGQVWFFKLRGEKEAVAAERDAFREWLGTLSLGTND